jgi:hypothetical protein
MLVYYRQETNTYTSNTSQVNATNTHQLCYFIAFFGTRHLNNTPCRTSSDIIACKYRENNMYSYGRKKTHDKVIKTRYVLTRKSRAQLF